MADIKKLRPFILRWEGGFVNDPLDRGGATNKGVTLNTFKHFFGADKTVYDLMNITDEQWLAILRECFWKPWKADQIKNQSIANICVDFAWASGTITAIRKVQKVLDLDADGKVGPKTLAMLNHREAEKVFDTIKKERLRFVDAICQANTSQVRFLRGWQNRINAFKYEE